MRLIIDRFEEMFAVLETDNNTFLTVDKSVLPENAKEGNVLVFDGQNYIIDIEETRKERSDNLKKLLELNPKKISEKF